MTAPDGVLIVGAGRFGRLALERLGKRVQALVDPRPPPFLVTQPGQVLAEDGIKAAARLVRRGGPLEWVVPALPKHFLALWLKETLPLLAARPIPFNPDKLPQTPSFITGEGHQCYLSLSTELCPDDCPQPGNICLSSQKPQGEPLFQRIRNVRETGFEIACLRSRQLAPGVGGLRCEEMLNLRERIFASGGTWLVATACRCHGVAQAWDFGPGGGEGAS